MGVLIHRPAFHCQAGPFVLTLDLLGDHGVPLRELELGKGEGEPGVSGRLGNDFPVKTRWSETGGTAHGRGRHPLPARIPIQVNTFRLSQLVHRIADIITDNREGVLGRRSRAIDPAEVLQKIRLLAGPGGEAVLSCLDQFAHLPVGEAELQDIWADPLVIVRGKVRVHLHAAIPHPDQRLDIRGPVFGIRDAAGVVIATVGVRPFQPGVTPVVEPHQAHAAQGSLAGPFTVPSPGGPDAVRLSRADIQRVAVFITPGPAVRIDDPGQLAGNIVLKQNGSAVGQKHSGEHVDLGIVFAGRRLTQLGEHILIEVHLEALLHPVHLTPEIGVMEDVFKPEFGLTI